MNHDRQLHRQPNAEPPARMKPRPKPTGISYRLARVLDSRGAKLMVEARFARLSGYTRGELRRFRRVQFHPPGVAFFTVRGPKGLLVLYSAAYWRQSLRSVSAA